MRQPKQPDRIARISDWTPLRRKYQTMVECFLYGTKPEWLQAEKEFWQLAKSEGLVEGEWWRK